MPGRAARRQLLRFTPHAPEWGAAGDAGELGISRTHAHRLLWSLANLGLLERQSNRRHRLGIRSLALASVLLETNPLIANALPLIYALNDELDLDAALAVWDRSCVLWLQTGADPFLVHREPRDCGAAGAVLLAGRPDAMIGDFRAGNGGMRGQLVRGACSRSSCRRSRRHSRPGRG